MNKQKIYDFLKISGIIGIHPNDNTATIWLKAADLVNLLTENGTNVNIFEI